MDESFVSNEETSIVNNLNEEKAVGNSRGSQNNTETVHSYTITSEKGFSVPQGIKK